MKNVILKILGTGYKNCYQADVSIYDSCGRMIWCGKTYNGTVKLCLKCNRCYTVKARLCSRQLCKTFLVNRCQSKYTFSFGSNLIPNVRNVTFYLEDSNYENMPIERGNVMLWQK